MGDGAADAPTGDFGLADQLRAVLDHAVASPSQEMQDFVRHLVDKIAGLPDEDDQFEHDPPTPA